VTQTRTIHRDTVKPEWVDYNGHLRDAFYMLIFSLATDAFMDRIGLDDAGRTSRGRSLFTLEAHINYLHEIKEGATVRVEASVLAFDAKRVHLYMEMFEAMECSPSRRASKCCFTSTQRTAPSPPPSIRTSLPVLKRCIVTRSRNRVMQAA
jgi:acyl-CoA thioesterase FadM